MGVSGPVPLTASMKARIDRIVTDELNRQFVPGAQVAVAIGGRVVYARGYGYRDLDDGLRTDASTAFAIGSVTKQFTAAAIMLLADEGKLDVHDKLSKYLPAAPHAADVTLENLLTHTSGIVGFTEQPNFSLILPSPSSPQRIIESIASDPLAFSPGTQWEYSNTNFVLLGLVIEKVSGENYPEFLQHHFFGRLHMSRAWFTRTEQIHADDARGYTEFMYGLPDEHAYLADWSWYDAAGGLTMSASDLARWDIALDSGSVVSDASFLAMSTPYHLKNGNATGYGYGLGVGSVFGRPTVGHDGLVSGFTAENLTFPKDRVAIVLLANADTFAYVPVIRQIAAVVYGTVDPPRRFMPAKQDAQKVAQARAWLERFLHGEVDYAQVTPDLALTLPSYRIAQLKQDGAIVGEPLDFQPASVDRRPPLTINRYRVRFRSGLAEFIFSINDSGKVAGFSLQAWD